MSTEDIIAKIEDNIMIKRGDECWRMIMDEFLPEANNWKDYSNELAKLKKKIIYDVFGIRISEKPKGRIKSKKDFWAVGVTKMRIDHEMRDIVRCFWDNLKSTQESNSSLRSVNILKYINDDLRVCHIITQAKAFGLIPPRDFIVVMGRKEIDKDRILIYNMSIDDILDWPSHPSHVRGCLGPNGFLYERLGEKRTLVTMLYNADLKIPRIVWPLYERKMVEAGLEDIQNVARYLEGKEVVQLDLKLPKWMVDSVK
ncbi:unnamed protein product [Cyprideis torosa]|uniref:Uncharacterized protein n=1 Tax=Cyprideis torosa TaxID=163714 RepID=A0A7R8W7R4_9CRUS|nr:unnamed protein product [Cyprideis torosa]CAG0882708.1 unnamed protein product [Cyprideis torosa]